MKDKRGARLKLRFEDVVMGDGFETGFMVNSENFRGMVGLCCVLLLFLQEKEGREIEMGFISIWKYILKKD